MAASALRVDEVAGGRGERDVQRDDVRAGERRAQVAVAAEQLDLHPERLCALRDRAADPARRRRSAGARRAAPGPSQPCGSHVRQRPARASSRASGSCRAAASSSAIARSAVASVSTSPVVPTATPRAAHAARSMLSKPDGVVAHDAQPRRGVEQLLVDAIGQQAQQPLGFADELVQLRAARRQVAVPDRDVMSADAAARWIRPPGGGLRRRGPRRRFSLVAPG